MAKELNASQSQKHKCSINIRKKLPNNLNNFNHKENSN